MNVEQNKYMKCTFMYVSFLTSLTVQEFSTIMSISMPAEGAVPTEKCKKSCNAKRKFHNIINQTF